jgi:hypothetical protein
MLQAAIGARAGIGLDVGANAPRLALLAALSAASGASLDYSAPPCAGSAMKGFQIFAETAILSDIL